MINFTNSKKGISLIVLIITIIVMIILASAVIITLNGYVARYNTANKDKDNFIELKTWNLDGKIVKFE